MYARSTTVLADPELIDAGVTHIRDKVMPMVLGIDGCVGMSMLVDRTTGRCIVTSAWQTAEAMHASEEQLRPVRDRAAEILGGTPQVDEWEIEIAVFHRDHASRPGAWVRAVWVQMDDEQAEGIIDVFKTALLPEIREFEGFCSASLMIDRTSGYAVSSVTFDSHDDMMRTRNLAAVARDRSTGEASGEVAEVGEFELALAHLRVPEMV